MDTIQSTFQPKQRNSEAMRAFGIRLKNQFQTNESWRRFKELQWLEDLRAYKGLYDPEVKIDAGASKVYPKITRSKVNIVLSRLHEMLFPETDKNWEIEPTPEPKISPEKVREIVQNLMQQKMMEFQTQLSAMQSPGTQLQPQPEFKPPSVEDVRLAIKKYAEVTCQTMSSVIDDQLTEMDYPEETKKVLRSGLLYGTGVMKGPMVNSRTKHKWVPSDEDPNDFIENEDTDQIPYFEAVRIWDWYPDMTTTEIDLIDGSFERHVMNKHDLRLLLQRDDFYSDMIESYLETHPDGDYVPRSWEVDLQNIEVEAGAGRNNTNTGNTMMTGTTNTSETNRTTNRQMGKKYQVLEYWGYVDGNDLSACGVEIPDVTLEYKANVWLLGNLPIKAVLYNGALDMYKVFYYEKDETSLFGEGLARVMRHSQIAIAAADRMILDNGACVAGPQVEVNWSLLTPDTDFNSFYPRKIWYREGRGVEAQYPAIRSLGFDSHIEELLKIADHFRANADEETTLPTWMIGQMVNNETAQATSGRMATIAVSIKDITKNFDAFTERIIRDLYSWNMDFNPRTDIKGDFNVKARGVSSLVMKEIRMQAINQMIPTLRPEDWVYIDSRDLLQKRMDAHDLNIKLRSEEEADKIREQQANSTMNKLQEEMLKSEIAKNNAQAMTNLTKAKEKNIIANKEAMTPPEQPNATDPRITDAQVAQEAAKAQGQDIQNQLMIDEHEHKKALADQEHGEKMMANRLEMAQGIEKHRNELEIKSKTADHAMKVKEKAAKSKKPVKKQGE